LYVLFQKRLIFSLLFLNLVFFIGMYFMASSDDAFGKAAPDVFNPEVDVLDIDPINDHSRYADKDPNGVIDHYQKNCSQLKRPHPNLTEAFRWHKVASKTFVYSAYFDNRTSMDFVLIWGISAGSAGWCSDFIRSHNPGHLIRLLSSRDPATFVSNAALCQIRPWSFCWISLLYFLTKPIRWYFVKP